ncbi:MAG: hypothetical protein JW928_01985 [Candidatus Aureabacteria bacterium]|nr:hypothetical protein [Candidatus Auribacterota bacterium]
MKNPEQRIKDIKEISVAIDTWDDIFSDFDPSPFKDRALSEDFILELKKRYREKRTGLFTITIYAPRALQNRTTQTTVVQRLRRYFRHRYLQRKKEIMRIRLKGALFVLVGISFLTFLTLITYFNTFNELSIEILGIIFMPLGWFGIWEGFSKIVDTSPVFIQEEAFFEKLSKASFRFEFLEEEQQ